MRTECVETLGKRTGSSRFRWLDAWPGFSHSEGLKRSTNAKIESITDALAMSLSVSTCFTAGLYGWYPNK